MNTNWNFYRVFYYVYKCGTTSAAANELHIAQSAVSHNMKQLEDTLGCKLFERSSYGMKPTAMGKLLYEQISEAISAIETAEQVIEAEISAAHKIINIGVSDITLQFFLVPYLESYGRRNPDVEVNLFHCRNVDELLQLFKEKKIDFAVLHDAPIGNDNFRCQSVKEVQYALFCSAKTAQLIREKVLRPEDLAKYPIVTLEKGCVGRKNFDEYVSANCHTAVKPAFEYALNASIIQHIKRNFSLGMVYHELIREEVEQGTLTELPVQIPFPPRKFWLIRPVRMHRKDAKKMAEYILSELSE